MEEIEIIPALDSILADESMFISKLQDIEPGILTREEIQILESEILSAMELLKEVLPAVEIYRPNPAVIGRRLGDAIDNITEILTLLTVLHASAPKETSKF